MLDLALVIFLFNDIVSALGQRHGHIMSLLNQGLRLFRCVLLCRTRSAYRPPLRRLILTQGSLLDQRGHRIPSIFHGSHRARAIRLLRREWLASLAPLLRVVLLLLLLLCLDLGKLDLLGRVYVNHLLQLLLELHVVPRCLPQELLNVAVLVLGGR